MKTRLAFVLAAGAALASAQQPTIQNAKVETRGLTGSLEAMVHSLGASQNGPLWIGYEAPAAPGHNSSCCWNNNTNTGCFLEPVPSPSNTQVVAGSGSRIVQLEGPTELVVMVRVESHQVDRIRSFTPDCGLDAGGLPVYWITGVKGSESVAFLSSVARDGAAGSTSTHSNPEQRRADSALVAIAMHSDPSADSALEGFTAASQPEWLRRKAVFWLGNQRGRKGYEVVSRILREDTSDAVREHAIFALTQSKEPDAMRDVIRAAREDHSTRVRGQALFWLAQRAGNKMAETAIRNAIENDPETEVKKKAVFALTQMPSGEGVPLLIQVARNNRNAAVRKQAMFWLGQSKDPRALSFFEEVLAK